MPMWQMFSDASNTFRWEISNRHLAMEEPKDALAPEPSHSHRLPSMADLLIQGSSCLMEDCNGNFDSIPSFRTGLGKPVATKQSSISRALAILGDETDEVIQTGHQGDRENRFGHSSNSMPLIGSGKAVKKSNSMLQPGKVRKTHISNSLFQTGSGKMVSISSAGLVRAKTLLGLEENSDLKHFEDLELEEEHLKSDEPCVLQSSLHWNKTEGGSNILLSGDSTNSLFQTGSGKMVKISSEGLVKAKTLLGLEENFGPKHFEGIEQDGEHLKSDEPCILQSSSHLNVNKGVANIMLSGDTRIPLSPLDMKFNLSTCEANKDIPNLVQCAAKPPQIRFHTAGGRSISVSSDALQRARSLLGDHEVAAHSNEENEIDNAFSFFKGRECSDISSDKENYSITPFSYQRIGNGQSLSKNFTSPLRIDSCRKQSSLILGNTVPGSNLIKKFDAEADDSANKACNGIPLNKKSCLGKLGHLQNSVASKNNLPERSLSGPLVDISNNISEKTTDIRSNISVKRRLGSNATPFKRPRISKFVTPLKKNSSALPHGPSPLATKQSSQKREFLMQFPFQLSRLYMKEYIGEAPSCQSKSENLPEQIRRMNPDAAEKYMFHNGFGSDCIGAEAFYHKLVDSGASVQYISKEWVANHYKWIVWKLASYERCYPAKFSGKLLTALNVLEELKYRYEREINHGHRSAIKRILEGDSPPSTPMVLCISSACSNWETEASHQVIASSSAENGTAAKIEVTDGWYSVYALLDALLAKKMAAGKLFLGQKLRIWGAGLRGWVGPVSPLEVSRSTNLLLHINGTYRAHWADRLGFCKGGGFPLAFRSIKSTGGVVPSTLVGILRIYPVLYRERLHEGGFIVRSERMESKASQLYNQRRSIVVEGIMSEFQEGKYKVACPGDDNDSEEGAKILQILETAADPEMLMAEMTSEQLCLFTSYQAKLEATRQSDMQKSLHKALEAAGLTGREVTPFMRLRVVGLSNKSFPKSRPQTGLITIWNPTEKQQLELLEGQAFVVSGLLPLSSDSSTLYLQTRGSNTEWLPLSATAAEHFEPFSSPRKSILLSNLGEVPLSSEFDVATFVIYVGEAYTTANQKKQWVFVADGSMCNLHFGESLDSLLAISFSAPFCENDLSAPVNQSLAGSTVGFFNLIKRAKDQVNNLWVAEATENSSYSLTFDHLKSSHLKDAADSAQKWANISSSTIENLRRRVLSVISNN